MRELWNCSARGELLSMVSYVEKKPNKIDVEISDQSGKKVPVTVFASANFKANRAQGPWNSVTKQIRDSKNRHVMPGYALDLTTVDPDDGSSWDFCAKSKRVKARRMLREQRPHLVIGPPKCKDFRSDCCR